MIKLYNDYSSYLRQRYGCKVYRIGLDAGFSCPTRDGTKGIGGCLFCSEEGSRSSYTNPEDSIKKQLTDRIKYLKDTRDAKKFIAYFQAFTNTHASPEKLKSTYDNILSFKDIIGISIGTRPDAIDREKLKIVASYKDRYEIWIEYGLQSIHDKTLKLINRGHSSSDFIKALELTKESGMSVCAHVILGLPGETKEDMIQTAKRLTELKVNGVKIHLLHVLKGSPLEKLYHEGKINILGQDEYVELVCDFLENLSRDIIIQRLTGEGAGDKHVAPAWALDKIGTINRVRDALKKRKSCQGLRLQSRLL